MLAFPSLCLLITTLNASRRWKRFLSVPELLAGRRVEYQANSALKYHSEKPPVSYSHTFSIGVLAVVASR